MRYVLTLSEINETNLPEVGRKAAGLGILMRAGIAVPAGFCLRTEAYEDFLAVNDLDDLINSSLSRLRAGESAALLGEEIRREIRAAEIPERIGEEIGRALQSSGLESTPVVVRSTATAEDLAESSFAGQYESFINITGKDQIIGRVKECWASLWNERAIVYRRQRALDNQPDKMAVIVQRMVNPEISGVMMTANPISGIQSEIILTASFGLAESIVSGFVTPDEYHIDKTNIEILSKSIADKKVESVPLPGGLIRRRPLSIERRRKQALPDPQVLTLSRMAIVIEELFGGPQEIEWSLEEGQFYFLQSRPLPV
jgi:phosphoenolpyruvate synthase/pyruvate phosphate dikinase